MELTYIFGILFGLFATTMFNLMPILQKDVLDQMETITAKNTIQSFKIMLSDRKWLIGGLLGILGGIPYSIALEWVGVSILQPLMNFGFIALVWASQKYLKEELSTPAKTGIVIMILMPIFISLGQVSNTTVIITEIETLNNLYFYLGLLGVIAFFLTLFSYKFNASVLLAIATGVFFAMGALGGQTAMAYIGAAGYQFPQEIGPIIRNAFSHPDLRRMVLFFGISIIFNSLAGYFFQVGLQQDKASRFTPINQTLNIMATITGGILVFGQFVAQPVWYIVGLGCAIVGTFLLGKYQIV